MAIIPPELDDEMYIMWQKVWEFGVFHIGRFEDYRQSVRNLEFLGYDVSKYEHNIDVCRQSSFEGKI